MNTVKITTFILICLIGYVVIKFIYKNFMKLLKLKEPEKIEERYVGQKVVERYYCPNTIEEFYQFFRDQFDEDDKPTMEDIVKFIDTQKENNKLWESYGRYGRITSDLSYSFEYKLLNFYLFTNQEINDLVLKYKQYILDIKKEKERIDNIMNTGFYVSRDRKLFCDFNEIITIMNVDEFKNRGVDAKYSSDVRVYIKAKHTCVIFKSGSKQEIKNDELVELFIQFKGIKN